MAGSPKTVGRLTETVNALTAEVTKLVADVEAIRVLYDTHTHDGVTVGAGVTGARSVAFAMAAAALTAATITQRYTF